MRTSQINRIIVIESIPDDEKQTGKELYDDIITRYIKYFNPEIIHEYYLINSKSEFIELLNKIKNSLDENDELILHIEAHGGTDELQFKNMELLEWQELEKILVEINQICKNKLHLNLATCHGMHVAEKISLKSTAPYQTYISALYQLNPNEILEDNSILYEELIKSRHIFKGFVEFLIRKQDTKLKMKDVKTVLEYVLNRQIMYFLIASPTFDLKSFFDHYLMINIDNRIITKIIEPQEKIEYILSLFFERYLPK